MITWLSQSCELVVDKLTMRFKGKGVRGMDKVRKSMIGTELHIMVETDADTLIGELVEIAQ